MEYTKKVNQLELKDIGVYELLATYYATNERSYKIGNCELLEEANYKEKCEEINVCNSNCRTIANELFSRGK